MSISSIVREHSAFIWSVADLLRGDYKQSEYGRVVLPLTVLRRLDNVLEPTKAKVLAEHKRLKGKLTDPSPVLFQITGVDFFNSSKLTFRRLLDDPDNQADDPEGGGRYTLKCWHSEKAAAEPEEGGWRHERIVLESLNREIGSITLADANGVKVVAEFIASL